ncbi:MAG: hypothetical protein WAW96_17825 [Alphaproteobacteria bacterium]
MNAILHNENHTARQRHQVLLMTAASAAILAAFPLNAASAEEIDAPAVLLADVAPVPDAELAENRGGFSIGHLNVSFGFTMTTNIQGPTMPDPITVTTNYTVDEPGHVTTTGPQVSGAQSFASTSSDQNDPSPAGTQQSNTNHGQQGNSNSNSSTSNSSNAQLAQNTPDNGKPTLTVQSNPQGNSFSISSNAGTTNVGVSTAQGILTTIANTANDTTIQTQVDLNYVVNNYHDIVQNAHAFQQALNIAQQMLALRGIAGH